MWSNLNWLTLNDCNLLTVLSLLQAFLAIVQLLTNVRSWFELIPLLLTRSWINTWLDLAQAIHALRLLAFELNYIAFYLIAQDGLQSFLLFFIGFESRRCMKPIQFLALLLGLAQIVRHCSRLDDVPRSFNPAFDLRLKVGYWYTGRYLLSCWISCNKFALLALHAFPDSRRVGSW